MKTDLCPDPLLLTQLLLGRLPEQDVSRIEDHLSDCPDCASTMEQLAADDPLVRAIRESQPVGQTADEQAVVSALIERIKPLRADNETHSLGDTLDVSDERYREPEEFQGRETLDDRRNIDFLAPPQEPDEIGRLGHYRILSVLGSGGMGIVFQAEDLQLRRIVALKAMRPSVATSESSQQRFLREARATAALEHDNIVTIYQVGRDGNIPFLAMQFLKGESLGECLNREKSLRQDEIVRIGCEVAAGLAAAHDQGLLHRDIKPDNIWLEAGSGRVKIVDFGLVRAKEEDDGLTQSGTIVGTPRYMAPEQAKGLAVDHRCDLFSLGSVLYHACTGEAPFSGGNVTATLIAVVQEDPRPVNSLKPDLNNVLAETVMRLLEKDPDKRFQSAEDVVQALRSVGTGRATDPTSEIRSSQFGTLSNTESDATFPAMSNESNSTMPKPAGGSHPASARAPRPKQVVDPFWKRPRNRIITLVAGGGLLLLLAAIVLLLPGKHGTIRIEIDDPEIEVTVHGKDITIKGAQQQDVVVEPGEHLLTIRRGDFQFQTDKFVLQKGKTVVLKVEYLRGEIRVSRGDTVIGQGSVRRADKPKTVPAAIPASDRASLFALGFDGKDDHVDIPTLKLPAGPFTVEAIVELESLPSGLRHANIVSDEGGGFYLTVNSKDGFSFLLARNGGVAGNELSNTAAVGQRMHVTGIVDGREIILSAHGKRTAHAFDEFPGSKGHVVLGLNPNNRSCFHGKLHEVRISKVARYSQKIGAHDRLQNDADTLALYHFDEGAGQVLNDSSGNGHHGKIVGARWLTLGDARRPAPPPAVAPFDAARARAHQQAWADYLGVPVERTNSLGMKFVLIPPGEFTMGSTAAEIQAAPSFPGEDAWWPACIASEAPQHKVILTKPIYMGIHEVTQSEYTKLMGENPSIFTPGGGFKERVTGLDTSDFPVENVDWHDANRFCDKLSEKENLEPFVLKVQEDGRAVTQGNGYRLPSEAEWEFACRAGTTSTFWSGNNVEDAIAAGWNGANSNHRTHAVGDLKANPFGLFDVHGNVWEWVLDVWGEDYYEQFAQRAAIDPWGPASPTVRVVRGGFWGTPELRCSSARRYGQSPEQEYGHNGFRIVLPVDVEATKNE